MPAHHSDPRYAFGICKLALRRAQAGAPRAAVAAAVLEESVAAGAAERWEALYAEASESVPEPWLGGDRGGGIEWI